MDHPGPELAHVVSCPAPYGRGGLGQHFAQVIEQARTNGSAVEYYSTAPVADARGKVLRMRSLDVVFNYTPVRFMPSVKGALSGALFDRSVATRLQPASAFTGFAGSCLHSLGRARELRYCTLEVESASAHLRHVLQMNDRAVRDCPVESHWLGERQVRRAIREYELADTVVVGSEYARLSFIQEGIEPQRIRRRVLHIGDRFRGPRTLNTDGVFRVVYVGALSAAKGIHLLLDAFTRMQGQAELTLVGGWATGGMRRFIAERLGRDPRIRLTVGDPLPHLVRADVYVHPSYQDGLGLAPLEAMACGVPVIVSQDTGMKEFVTEGVNGWVVPTGNAGAIFERLEALYRSR